MPLDTVSVEVVEDRQTLVRLLGLGPPGGTSRRPETSARDDGLGRAVAPHKSASRIKRVFFLP